MAAVPSDRTSLEQQLASFMWVDGPRGWRRSIKVERARPDFVYSRARLVVFVDGCFWHGCPQCCRRPATNVAYWNAKLDRNMERDIEQTQRLEAAGWTVLRFWGHEVDRDARDCARQVRLAYAQNVEPSVRVRVR